MGPLLRVCVFGSGWPTGGHARGQGYLKACIAPGFLDRSGWHGFGYLLKAATCIK